MTRDDTVKVLGLVAAAGTSGRMGTPKALLSTRVLDDADDNEPWVRRIARALREGGVDEVVVTVPDGPVGDAVTAVVVDIARVTANPRPQEGLTGSIVAALDLVCEADLEGLVLCPVDAPGVDAAVVAAMLQALRRHGVPVVVTCGGRRGHPVAFPRASFAALRAAGHGGGPRAVLASGPVHEVAVDDERVLWDLDTPDAIAAARTRGPAS